MIPIVSALVSAGGAAAESVAAKWSSSFTTSLANAAIQTPLYAVNAAARNQLPDPQQCWTLYNQGLIDRNRMAVTCCTANLDFAGNSADPHYRQLWESVLVSVRPKHSVGDYYTHYVRGDVLEEEMQARIDREGFAHSAHREWFTKPDIPLSFGQYTDAWTRKLINDFGINEAMRFSGYTHIDDISLLGQLVVNTPQADTFASWLNRGLFDPAYVAFWQLDSGYNDQLATWYSREERAHKSSDLYFGEQPQFDVAWPTMLWRATRQQLDVNTAIACRIRFGPETAPSDITPWTPMGNFTQEMLNGIYVANGIPNPVANWLYAMQTQTLGFRQIAQAYQMEVIGKEEVKRRMASQGFLSQDINLFLDLQDKLLLKRAPEYGAKSLHAAVVKAYETGTVTREVAAVGIYVSHLVDPLEIAAFNQLLPIGQYQTAIADNQVFMELESADIRIQEEKSKGVVAAIRKAYITGAITDGQAISTLIAAGITTTRASDYVSRWKLDSVGSFKFAGVGQVIKWFLGSWINRVEALVRLNHLGYSTRDANIMLTVAQADQSEKQARQMAKQIATQQKGSSAALAKQLKAQESAIKESFKRLLADANVGKIEKFYKDGILTRHEAEIELADRQIDGQYITMRLDDIDSQKAKGKAGKSSGKQTPPTSGSSTTP